MSAPVRARVHTDVALHPATGSPPHLFADDQVWAAEDAEQPWLLAADVVSVRRPDSLPPPGAAERGAAPPHGSAGGAACRGPARRVLVVGGSDPAVLADGCTAALPARSAWDARVLGAFVHTWLAAGLDTAELGRAWPGRVLTGFRAAAGRRSVAVSLRLGETRACCRWSMRC
ncbi:hypothetical protein [Streptomonospora alba]|uniref:hypothetical protein n=1 Tax=Streptomonospora alba TaxID=183763 RepID=UPI0012EE9748|nr:hypothetical protein [Streptomonospora alba]